MQNPMELTGKTIIVTGAGQGIGSAIAELVHDLGGNVVALDRNAEGVTAFAAAKSERVLAVSADVSDAAACERALAAALEHFGAVHGLVNNAGITRTAMIEKMTREQWQAVLDVNLSGAFFMLQAVGKHMIARAKEGDAAPGAIVNISSDAGRRGTMGQINYGAAKAGLFGVTMSAAREWARYGVRVNTINFGVVDTPMTETLRSDKFREQYLAQIPLGRISTPAEVAQPVVFLLSNAASYITGQHLSVNGGFVIGL